mmetsp:Transcript_15718/g.15855  ORF Transcript_15718/g.15855 Transcript_15718/m.15855 type:complete len:94 (-) Transcript_15718:245-526(-)|eukprot:CAMPEP_0182431532 /NCGR_PEP_ID=MMETSP1167-20130531/49870_1 /TAXON_ID=2988 /ORGANISM="Mallomonas Sp, Strain CCMP3275" /LENGTH=93 /DNA_ID=CAMNT_0024617965 /DNA_START=164 /DNA_END=445 /DNA_ORIENTATION=-
MATRQEEAKGVDSVTDYVEEREDVDVGKATQGLSSLAAANASDASAPTIRISQEDITVLTEEIEVTKDVAERMLQAYGGSLKAALTAYVTGEY